MIIFDRFRLDNGLRILVHEDRSTPLAAMNILYDVGSRDEDPGKTGLAHLFEHLMFGGTGNIPEYDLPLQMAGGENNAFTTNDITNYYLTLPAENIETGFWLESDRMDEIDFSQRNLDVQKKVVIEEFNQRYINQPYGDALLLLRPLAYKGHPYRWPAIGRDISHIRNTTLGDIREFFFSHYAPNNAIISFAGNVTKEGIRKLTDKWFSSLPERTISPRQLPPEPVQDKMNTLTVERNVPSHALYKAWHIGPRNGNDFYVMDLLTDLLAGGESGRLYIKLVRERNLFSEINAYLTSDIDPGLMVVNGKLMAGVSIDEADEAVTEVINDLIAKPPDENEMEKVKNRFESSTVLQNTGILQKAMSLAFCELLGDPSLVNKEVEKYRSTDQKMVLEATRNYLKPDNCSTLRFMSLK
jgi:zinc protease